MAKFGEAMRGLMVFIQDIRACKSKEAEMKRINKELANIRSKFKNEKLDGYQKKKYVCKLLFIFLLGIDIDFGYQEAVNLLSSLKFSEKQIGYLFVSVIFGSNHELMPLVIQSIKLDLQSSNPVYVTLAMQCAANIASKEMASQVGPEIPKLIVAGHSSHQVKQTASLCLVKLLRIDPKAISHSAYAPRFIQLINDKHIGVVTASCSLIIEGARAEPEAYRACVSTAAQRLHRIVTSTQADLHDYMYYFIPAPWLSILLLRLIQMFPSPSEDDALTRARLVESIEDILNRSQDPSKSKKVQHSNAKNAVLFEAIKVIIHLESESQLQVRACNILGSFLGVKETNLRYLAMEHLGYLAVLGFSHDPVKKHQSTVISSLKTERDVSVRKRAVDLLYAMCDHSNAEVVVKELLDYLKTKADYTIREELVLKIAILAEKFAPDSEWYVNTMLNLIRWAGDYVSEEVWHRVIQVIINREDVQGYAAKTCFEVEKQGELVGGCIRIQALYIFSKLNESLQASACHETMINVGAYILGEFGNLIAGDDRSKPEVQLKLLHSTYHLVSVHTKTLLLTTYMKFINLFPEIKPQVIKILGQDSQARSDDVEVQQRALEYMRLATVASPDLLASVLEEMPPFPEKGSTLLAKLKKKDPKQALIHQDKPGLETDNCRIEQIDPKKNGPIGSQNLTDGHIMGGAGGGSDTLVDVLGLGELQDTFASAGFGMATAAPPLDENRLTPGWEAGFKIFLFKNSGILFEDDSIQIGIKSEYKENLGRLTVFYGNKSGSPIINFSADVDFPEGPEEQLKVISKPTENVIESSAQLQQLITVECVSAFTDAPRLKIKFTCGGVPKLLVLKLPLLLNKFLEASVMDTNNFFERWKALGERPEQEAQEIFLAQKPMDAAANKNKLSGFGLSVLTGVDPNATNFVSAGIFNTSTARIGCLVRLEPNIQIKKYRLTIRTTNPLVSKHVRQLLLPEF